MSAATAAGRFDLSGRVIVVTGASKGIGRELTVLLTETGAVVVPTYARRLTPPTSPPRRSRTA